MVMEEQQFDMELDSERVPVPQVQKSVEESHLDTIKKVTNTSRVKPRLRKKALHAAILKQMEFYFGDANLSKDRFLNNLVKEDPYVDLNIFLRFNKIRDLTTDINRIAKALQTSTILSLSEDGMKVRRVTPIIPKENIDECTVYVQNLPPDSDHETLSSIFAQYGQVEYVSVPRFKNNRKIKGFAFVEFDTPENANKCLKAFKKKGCVLPLHTAPNDLLSITTFDDSEKDVTFMGKKRNLIDISNCITNTNDNAALKEMDKNEKEEEHESTGNTSDSQDNKMKKSRKRKHKDANISEAIELEKQVDNETGKAKRKKCKNSEDTLGNEEEATSEKQNDISVEETSKKLNKCKKNMSPNQEQISNILNDNEKMVIDDNVILSTEEQENMAEKRKKRKKRKKRSKMEDFSYSMGLQVMAKKDWKHLRNKYLELQRSKMKQLKQHLKKTRWNQWTNYDKNKLEKEESDEKDKILKQAPLSTCRFSFTPGVIVKIEMDKPCTDPKSLKTELKNNNSVKYIDVEDGSCFAYVRCDTTESAQVFTQKSNEERHMSILKDEEEKTYWNKILHDREEKLSKKIKVKQRGRNKLLKKAEKELGKHIKFDEV